MKNIFLAVLLSSFFFVKAQNKKDIILNPYEKKNELILDLIGPLLSGGINASYERHLNKKSSLGVTLCYIYDNTKETDMNYSISPYYRMYFGKKYASGFFVEGFGMVHSTDGKKIYDTVEKLTFTENPSVINLTIGVGLGWRGVAKSGFTYGANLGMGITFLNADKTDHDHVAKFSLNVGYRF
ncbi:DUF3575 domain-containing protein [Myroides guanonis]|uniref:DUF3575 domain-containing protein n=1 Tax=Myroides guanonis TaxID=1150112 RepID=A0A1I3ULJ7_9FLAO|nr:DUF3575 domain-containing protein [Myroides guanonis]SFJ82651.1 hypothetical protein SAMN04487893_1185 [Myroides guanonis]